MQKGLFVFIILVWSLISLSCNTSEQQPTPTIVASREKANPPDVRKISIAEDIYPPVIHLPDWQQPVPMSALINTNGAEDSPFITPDGQNFFFFYTPDVRIPAEKQLLDGATGIWWTQREGDSWRNPTRMVLNDDLALDGCPFVQRDEIWFCSARAGNQSEINWYIAEFQDGSWQDWKNAGQRLNVEIQTGELHISSDGQTMIFHSAMDGGYGGLDLWKTTRQGDSWSDPLNLGSLINSEYDEGWPFVSSDGTELWFTSPSRLGYAGPAIYRSILIEDVWSQPIEVISNFAGELTMDTGGTLYFTHHFFNAEGDMLEADIYMAKTYD
ncbi:MAG: PD40 domain-containing protein [Anaerolineaceae bacterium]|nr:PD40 domain-containing protein [Anaerolineaceae bacterium]